jgi:hypothetical protein
MNLNVQVFKGNLNVAENFDVAETNDAVPNLTVQMTMRMRICALRGLQ